MLADVAAYKGLRGAYAASRVFPIVYTNDVAVATMLGLGKPREGALKAFTTDVVEKFVQVAATSFIFDRYLDSERPPSTEYQSSILHIERIIRKPHKWKNS